MALREIDEESLSTLPGSAASTSTKEDVQHLLSWRDYFMQDVDTAKATIPLSFFFFMSGFINAISFTAIYVWCGFQTGNTVQLSLALARLFAPGQTDLTLQTADRQALVSLLTFGVGGLVAQVGDRIGNNTRLWLFAGTFLQAILTALAAITIHLGGQSSIAGTTRGNPAWTNALGDVALGFASASMGFQGVMAKRLKSEFNACIVLTTTWVEFVGDPKLFRLGWVKTRDHRLYAIGAAFLGGFMAFSILDRVSDAGAFGVGAGIRVLIAVGWLFIPAKEVSDRY